MIWLSSHWRSELLVSCAQFIFIIEGFGRDVLIKRTKKITFLFYEQLHWTAIFGIFLVEDLHFSLCLLSLLQVAAVYRDPSVGNFINIMIIRLIVVHNEQVSSYYCVQT